MTDHELVKAVAESYKVTGSFKKTAAELQISTAKVRKALLTAGVWTNETAEEIQRLREVHENWTDQQIADHLHISLNAVQMYTPYKVGPYEGDSPSAQRTAEYRRRKKEQKDDVDGNRKEVGDLIESMSTKGKEEPFEQPKEELALDDRSLDDLPLFDHSWYEEERRKAEEEGLPFPHFRYNDDPNAMPHVDDQFYLDYRLVEPAYDHDRQTTLMAMKIRLEIDTDGMSAEELARAEQEYGVRTGWTRDLIVPSYIPLHYLHYIIQRAFGFENVADHVFQLPDEQFEVITEESLKTYCRLCGVLFRFPYGNDEELYWDDDYDGKKSVRTWLKEKYDGSWNTGAGTGYMYADNQYRIWKWLGDRVPDFHKLATAFDADDFYKELTRLGAPEEYSIGDLDEAGIDEVGATQLPVNNILENVTLEELVAIEPDSIDFSEFTEGIEQAEDELLESLTCLEKARELMDEAQELYKLLGKRMKSGQLYEDDLLVKKWRATSKKAARAYTSAGDGSEIPYPFTDELIYLYDFGGKKGEMVCGEQTQGEHRSAKWRIKIKVLDEYWDYSIYYVRGYIPTDANGVDFEKDPEHEAEWADRLRDMCRWKEKLEVVDSRDRWIRPSDESAMMIELRPEQELLPEERERIEKDRAERTAWRLELGYEKEKEKETVVDDVLYAAIREVILNCKPVCIGKEGTEPGEDYPLRKIRNTSIENLV